MNNRAGGYTAATEQNGSSPQSFMMLDIAALQQEYGANFNNLLHDVTYSWDPNTGEEFINGVGQGRPAQNKIYETVWTGGANSTFDLSKFTYKGGSAEHEARRVHAVLERPTRGSSWRR
jgi:serralysin